MVKVAVALILANVRPTLGLKCAAKRLACLLLLDAIDCFYAYFFAMQSPMTRSSQLDPHHFGALTQKSLRPRRSAAAQVPTFTRERQRSSSRERESAYF